MLCCLLQDVQGRGKRSLQTAMDIDSFRPLCMLAASDRYVYRLLQTAMYVASFRPLSMLPPSDRYGPELPAPAGKCGCHLFLEKTPRNRGIRLVFIRDAGQAITFRERRGLDQLPSRLYVFWTKSRKWAKNGLNHPTGETVGWSGSPG